MKQLEDAVEIFEQALRIEPDNVEVLMKLGYARSYGVNFALAEMLETH